MGTGSPLLRVIPRGNLGVVIKTRGRELRGRVTDVYCVMLSEELDPRGVREGGLILPRGGGRVTGTLARGLEVHVGVCQLERAKRDKSILQTEGNPSVKL